MTSVRRHWPRWMRLLRGTWRTLGDMRVAALLIAMLAVLIVVGSLIPQMPAQPEVSPAAAQEWLKLAYSRFGSRARWYDRLGLFRLHTTICFRGLCFLLTASTLACTVRRIGACWRRAARPVVERPLAFFERAPLHVMLAAPSVALALTALRSALAESGFRRVLEVAREAECSLYADRHRWSALGTILTHLAVVAIAPAAWAALALDWQESSVVLAPGQSHVVTRKPAVVIRYDGPLASAGGGAQGALVTLESEGRALLTGTLKLGEPLHYRGMDVHFWSAGAAAEGGEQVILNVTSRPGAIAVWIIVLLMAVGMTVTIYFPHDRIWARIAPTGQVLLSGMPGESLGLFRRRFELLVARYTAALSDAGKGEAGSLRRGNDRG